jgi:hypothetical protein
MCLGEVLLVPYVSENLEGVTRCDTWILLDKHDRSLIKSPIYTCYVFSLNLIPVCGVIVLPVPVIFLVIGHFLLVIGGGGGEGGGGDDDDDDDYDDDDDSDSDYNNSVKFNNCLLTC